MKTKNLAVIVLVAIMAQGIVYTFFWYKTKESINQLGAELTDDLEIATPGNVYYLRNKTIYMESGDAPIVFETRTLAKNWLTDQTYNDFQLFLEENYPQINLDSLDIWSEESEGVDTNLIY